MKKPSSNKEFNVQSISYCTLVCIIQNTALGMVFKRFLIDWIVQGNADLTSFNCW